MFHKIKLLLVHQNWEAADYSAQLEDQVIQNVRLPQLLALDQYYVSVNEQGKFENFGHYTDWKARTDDHKFIEDMEDKNIIIAKESL